MRWILALLGLVACGRYRFDARGDAVSDAMADAGVESPLITGGMFYRGYDVAFDGAYPDKTAPATISSFRLDKYEVTVARFRRFVDAGKGTQLDPPFAGAGARTADPTGWDASWTIDLPADETALLAALKCEASTTWTDMPGANENKPMSCLTWYEAFAFCTWDGGFLPTEAESEYAALGGSLQRAYPWSSPPEDTTIGCNVANYGPCGGALEDVGSDPAGDGLWGQSDLAGNQWEWALDWGNGAFGTPCVDCAYLTPGSYRVIRGGSWFNSPSFLRSANRNYDSPGVAYGNLGVRCARAP